MKFETLAAKKFNTSENTNMNALVGGNTSSSQSITYVNGRRDGRSDSDVGGGGSTSSVSVVNSVVTYDA
jgi:hypothetical protein